MLEQKTHTARKAGFTLIELSIVLVIIGLIVGGVLVGQDLIKAAEVRATVGQVEKYNAAINTFRSKYNGIPGDLTGTQATNFGLLPTARADTTTVSVHGNGLIEGCATVLLAGCETVLFWQDLSSANLISNSISGNTDAAASIASSALGNTFPAAKLGRGNYFTVFSNGGLNYYELTGITSTTTGAYTLTTALTPNEAYNIDSKLDDGAPLTGVTLAKVSTSALNTASVSGDHCVLSGAYDIANYPTTATCQLSMRFN